MREKLDRLDQAFLFEPTIDIDTYDRHRDKLREELTLVQMGRHATRLEELDREGILAFAECVLPSAVEPLSTVVAESEAAPAAAVFYWGSSLRRKEVSRTGNAAGFQLLEPCFGGRKKNWWT
jgi:hypothetical protein